MSQKPSENRSSNRQVDSALAFFDIFRFPLTIMEAYRWQYCKSGNGKTSGIVDVLSHLKDSCMLQHGFFSLPDSQADLDLRWRRQRLSERKFRIARRFAYFARLVPSVRLVAVGNSLSWSNAEQGSDIDIFLVVSPGTVWITRLFLAIPLILLRLRPVPGNHKDKLCLSFIVSQDSLDLSGLMIGTEDVYLSFWLAGLFPIYDVGGVMGELWQSNRKLLLNLPAAYPRCPVRRRTVSVPFAHHMFPVGIFLMRRLEPLARILQKWRFPKQIRELANLDSRVITTDSVLKFHIYDRREEYLRSFTDKMTGL